MKIGFTGAQGTGKSTLVDLLCDQDEFSSYYRSINPQRTLRNNIPNFPLNTDTNIISQSGIAALYAAEVIQHDNYISDRTIIDVLAYSYYGRLSDIEYSKLETMYHSVANMYDVVFYTPIEFQLEADGTRSVDTEYQSNIDSKCKDLLNKYAPNFITLTGTIDQRMNTIHSVLRQLQN